MNDYEQELRDKWSNISYQQGGSLELGIQHPLEVSSMMALVSSGLSQ